MHNNVYLLTHRDGSQVLIDAADDAPRVLEFIAEGGKGLDALITTHQHWDHVRALAYTDASEGNRVHLFTGDALFPGGVGNTKLPGQNFDSLYADVTERIFDVYDDRTIVYPGHGADTTLGKERPHLGEWRARGW